MLWGLAAPAYLVRNPQILDGVAADVGLWHAPKAVTILQARQAKPSAHPWCPQETFTAPSPRLLTLEVQITSFK